MKLSNLDELQKLLSTDDKEKLAQEATQAKQKRKRGDGQHVTVSLDKKARRGKTVTVISGLALSTEMRDRLAKDLRQFVSAGGTEFEDVIEIQGDHLTRIVPYLEKDGFTVRIRK